MGEHRLGWLSLANRPGRRHLGRLHWLGGCWGRIEWSRLRRRRGGGDLTLLGIEIFQSFLPIAALLGQNLVEVLRGLCIATEREVCGRAFEQGQVVGRILGDGDVVVDERIRRLALG